MDVAAWLRELALEDYAEAFAENGVDAKLLCELTNDDLKDLGVARLADRKRLLKAIAELAREDESRQTPRYGGVAPLGERRQVTVLFADLSEFSGLSTRLDAEELHALLNRFFAVVDGVIEAYGGTIDKHIGDEVMAVFGAPTAHSNDPERAVRAAIDIHLRLASLSEEVGQTLKAHIGIASGQVVASGTGSRAHLEYTVTGSSVNLASRLKEIAGSGETLISAEVYRFVLALVSCTSLGEVTLKGIGAPIQVWRLEGMRPDARPGGESPFVGRHSECRQVMSILDECDRIGIGRTVLLRGEAGIGKSRTAAELAKRATQKGFTCHKCLVLDFGVEKGQAPIPALVRSLLEIPPGSGKRRRQEAAEAALRDGAADANQRVFLNELLDLAQPIQLRSLYDAMDNETRSRGAKGLVGGLLTHLSRQRPLLLVVEDIHWADEATLAHLANLAEALAACPVVLLMTSRHEGDPLGRGWQASLAGTPLTTIDIAPLSDGDAQIIAKHLLEEESSLVEHCVDKAGGNPLFLEQLARNAEESAGEIIPGSIRSLVQARIDRLPLLDKQALQAAAVIGQRFALPVIRHLLALQDYGCQTLIDHHLVRRDGDSLLFTHALIWEGVYTSLLKARRKELHVKAAAWFSDKNLDLKAEHLDRGEDPAAVKAYLAAAENQAGLYRYDRAMQFVERGLELAADCEERFMLTCFLGELLHEGGKTDQSIDAFRQAQGLAGDDLQKCRVEIGLAGSMRMIDRYDEAFVALDDVEPLAQRNAFHLQLARLHHLRGNLCFPSGQIDRCWQEHKRALDNARLAGSLEWEARALGGLADAEYARGRLLSVKHYLDRCLEICRSEGFGRIEVANVSIAGGGGSRYYRGDLQGALDVSLEAEALAKRVGHERAEILAHVGCYISLFGMAEMGRAKRHIARSKELADRLGAKRFLARALQFDGKIDLWQGDRAAAIAKFRDAMTISRQTGIRYAGPAILAGIALTSDDQVESCEALGEGEALLQGGCVSASHFELNIGAIETSLRKEAWDSVERYCAALEAYTSEEPLPLTDFFIERGRALAVVGRDGLTPEAAGRVRRLCDSAREFKLRVALPLLESAIPPRGGGD